MSSSGDPYAVLGVEPGASDAELRAAYRRLVKQHHPDHNGGSEESEALFEAVQDAYARVRGLRATATGGSTRSASQSGSAGPRPTGASRAAPGRADDLDSRLAAMEHELREAQKAREEAERARRDAIRAAREAAAARQSGQRTRPTDEELGYFSTDDSIAKILADARDALADRLDEIADKLKGD